MQPHACVQTYKQANRRLECCQLEYRWSQMPCFFIFLSINLKGGWYKLAFAVHFWGSVPVAWVIWVHVALCLWGLLFFPLSLSLSPGQSSSTHHLEWRLTGMNIGRKQRDTHTLSCMTDQQPSTAIKHWEHWILLDRFKFPGTAVIRCFALFPCSQYVTHSLLLALFWYLFLHCPGVSIFSRKMNHLKRYHFEGDLWGRLKSKQIFKN